MNKRGSLLDVVLWSVFAFIITVFFGLWLYSTSLVNDTLSGIDTSIGTEGDTIGSISDSTFGNVVEGYGVLRILSFVLILSMVLTIFMTNLLISRVHPAFFIVYIFITVLGVIFGVYISNAYQTFLTDATFGVTLQTFTASTYVLLYLPYFVAAIGLFGTIFLLGGILRDTSQGGPL